MKEQNDNQEKVSKDEDSQGFSTPAEPQTTQDTEKTQADSDPQDVREERSEDSRKPGEVDDKNSANNGNIKGKKGYFATVLKSKNFKYGSVAMGTTIFLVVCAVILSMIVDTLSEKYQLKLDLTSVKAFELSDESIDFLKTLDKAVEIDVLQDENTFKTKAGHTVQVYEILKQYSSYSSQIKLNFVDVEKDPSYASKFPKQKLESDMIVLSSPSDESCVTLSLRELFDLEPAPDGSERVTSSKAESEITSAILNVIQKDKPKVVFLNGYEEEEMPELKDLLDKNGYETHEVTISTSDIPSDAKVVVILAPDRDYMKESVERIEKFLYNDGNYGKSVVYAANPQTKSLSNLESVFSKHGIKFEQGITFETDAKALLSNQNCFSFFSNYVNEAFTKGIKSTKVQVCVPSPKTLQVTDESKVSVLMQSSKESGMMPLDRSDDWRISQDKLTGPIPTALISSFGKSQDEKGSNDGKSRLVVFGSHVVAKRELLESTYVNNSAYLVNMFKVMSGNESRRISIEPKSLEARQLGIKSNDANVIAAVFIIFVPGIVLLACVLVLVRRKNL
ncbi:MAG: GldG family protein [Oscillospiraceae bacterium]|nr:GldG family protein [Oscillospiraceae bacterium]